MFECVFRTKIKRNHLETKQNMNNFHTKNKESKQDCSAVCSAVSPNCSAVCFKLLSSLVSSLGQTAEHLVQKCWFVWYLLVQNYVVLVWVCCCYMYIYVVLGALFSIKNTALNWHQHRGNDALETLQCQK